METPNNFSRGNVNPAKVASFIDRDTKHSLRRGGISARKQIIYSNYDRNSKQEMMRKENLRNSRFTASWNNYKPLNTPSLKLSCCTQRELNNRERNLAYIYIIKLLARFRETEFLLIILASGNPVRILHKKLYATCTKNLNTTELQCLEDILMRNIHIYGVHT